MNNSALKKVGKVVALIFTPTVVLIVIFLIWFIWKKTKQRKEKNRSTDSLKKPSIDPNACPVCGQATQSQCKCGGSIKHSLEDLQRGHGSVCGNGHRWSYQTEHEAPIVVLEELTHTKVLPGANACQSEIFTPPLTDHSMPQ